MSSNADRHHIKELHNYFEVKEVSSFYQYILYMLDSITEVR